MNAGPAAVAAPLPDGSCSEARRRGPHTERFNFGPASPRPSAAAAPIPPARSPLPRRRAGPGDPSRPLATSRPGRPRRRPASARRLSPHPGCAIGPHRLEVLVTSMRGSGARALPGRGATCGSRADSTRRSGGGASAVTRTPTARAAACRRCAGGQERPCGEARLRVTLQRFRRMGTGHGMREGWRMLGEMGYGRLDNGRGTRVEITLYLQS